MTVQPKGKQRNDGLDWNMSLMKFLHISRNVTDKYIENGKVFEEGNLAKIEEEHKEFLEAFCPDNELEEFWDSFWSKLTRLHLTGYTDEQIFRSAVWKWGIIYNKALEYKS